MSNEAQRLGDLVASRRVALGYATQDEFAKAAELHTRTINGIENARRSAGRSTRAILEAALQWEPGSIRAILEGGDPTPIESREPPGSSHEEPGLSLGERLERVREEVERMQRDWAEEQRRRGA